MFWPSTESPAHEDEYRDAFKFHSWRPARLRISSGQLLTDEEEAGAGELSGRVYTLRPLTKKKGKNWRDISQEDALPPICPGCGADYSSKERRINTPLAFTVPASRRRVRSSPADSSGKCPSRRRASNRENW